MIPLGAIRYILISAVFVLSFFFALRLLIAHDMRREAWRHYVKNKVYLSRRQFKALTILMGWMFLFIALGTAYYEMDRFMASI